MQRLDNNIPGASEPIELHIKCLNLENQDAIFGESDGQCAIFLISQTGQRTLLGETEVRNNCENPEFENPIRMDYIFERNQTVSLVCYDVDDGGQREIIGEVGFNICQVIVKQKKGLELILTKDGNNNGRVNIRCVRLGQQIYEYKIDVKVEDAKDIEYWSKSDPFIVFFRPANEYLRSIEPSEVKEWHKCHETEFVKNDLNPNFRPFSIDSARFCKNEEGALIKVGLYDNSKDGDHELLGVTYFTVKGVGVDHVIKYTFLDEDNEKSGVLIFENFQRFKSYSIADYLRYGVKLSMVTAFDFTSNDVSPPSLHVIPPGGGYNKYEQALVAVGQILQYYDTDNQIPSYGYGFSAPKMGINEVTFCYPLTGDFSNPNCQGFQSILPLYRRLIQQIVPGGPTIMAPIMQRAIQAAEGSWKNNKSVYNVILILTDGVVDDKKETKALIQAARHLPLSILIVGIGSSDMSGMYHLDDDRITDERDIVQFVHFDKHCHSKEQLAKELLKEIPHQLISFYRQEGIFPN